MTNRNERYYLSIINIVLYRYCIIIKVLNFQEDNTRQMHDVCTTDDPKRKYEALSFL